MTVLLWIFISVKFENLLGSVWVLYFFYFLMQRLPIFSKKKKEEEEEERFWLTNLKPGRAYAESFLLQYQEKGTHLVKQQDKPRVSFRQSKYNDSFPTHQNEIAKS